MRKFRVAALLCAGAMACVLSRFAAVIVGTLLLITCLPCSVVAADIEGVHFADECQHGAITLELHCVGLLRYKVLFKGYVAALYLGAGVSAGEALADVPKRLELNYFWSIKGAKFGKAGDEILAHNVDPDTLARLRPRLEQINALYENVKPGDRYALTYVPGFGTELALNGRSKGIIAGADFAAAYFRIWLGDQPIDTTLRDQLLRCPRPAAQHRMYQADPYSLRVEDEPWLRSFASRARRRRV